jgi:hypothetical protein
LKDLTAFTLNVSTSAGSLTIPQYGGDIVLNGRESKIIVTDFTLGKEKLVYSTAEVLTVSMQDDNPLVFLWLPAGESGEFLLTSAKHASIQKRDGCSNVQFKAGKSAMATSYTQSAGSCVLQFDNGIRFVLVDRAAAYGTWVPSLSNNPFTYENTTIVVQGLYLVRSAAIQKKTIALTGDWSNATTLEVFAPKSVDRVTFNGKEVKTTETSYGSLVGNLKSAPYTVNSIKSKLPGLKNWKVNDGLPERQANYDDSRWIGKVAPTCYGLGSC